MHHLEGLGGVRVEPRLSSEHADREHDHVEPTRVRERARDRLAVPVALTSVEQAVVTSSQPACRSARRRGQAAAVAAEQVGAPARRRQPRRMASPISELPPTSSATPGAAHSNPVRSARSERQRAPDRRGRAPRAIRQAGDTWREAPPGADGRPWSGRPARLRRPPAVERVERGANPTAPLGTSSARSSPASGTTAARRWRDRSP